MGNTGGKKYTLSDLSVIYLFIQRDRGSLLGFRLNVVEKDWNVNYIYNVGEDQCLTRRRRVKRASGRITTWTILENWTKGIRIISRILLLNKALTTGICSYTILLSYPTPSIDGVGSSTDLPLSHYLHQCVAILMVERINQYLLP